MTGPTCGSCGAPIVWGVTPKGKRIPLDPPEKRFIQGRSGQYIVVDAHLSHYATCPQADAWRKKNDD